MTLDQIDQMVRQANPVPDLTVLEPVDASVLVFDQQRRTDMQTRDRVEVDSEPDKPNRRFLAGIAAAAAIVIGALVLVPPGDSPVATSPGEPAEISAAFIEAYGAYDVERTASYLTAEALVDFGGDMNSMLLEASWRQAVGYKVMLDSCVERTSSASGAIVRCTYDFHAIRSDEIGLGPFGGSYFDMTVLDGKIISLSDHLAYEEEFSPQVWEPFAAWVAENHPEDITVLYEDPTQTMQRFTDESIALWDQRSREYVAAERARAEAESIATQFVEAYAAFDADKAASYLTDNALAEFGGFDGDAEDLRLGLSNGQAAGFKWLPKSCEAENGSPSGTSVRCTYDYHGIRSDEIGLGPYGGSWFEVTVLGGEIVSVSDHIEFTSNGFSSEMWEPFAEWVAGTYPDDVAVMYTDSSQAVPSITEESNQLWEQRSREYVTVVAP